MGRNVAWLFFLLVAISSAAWYAHAASGNSPASHQFQVLYDAADKARAQHDLNGFSRLYWPEWRQEVPGHEPLTFSKYLPMLKEMYALKNLRWNATTKVASVKLENPTNAQVKSSQTASISFEDDHGTHHVKDIGTCLDHWNRRGDVWKIDQSTTLHEKQWKDGRLIMDQ